MKNPKKKADYVLNFYNKRKIIFRGFSDEELIRFDKKSILNDLNSDIERYVKEINELETCYDCDEEFPIEKTFCCQDETPVYNPYTEEETYWAEDGKTRCDNCYDKYREQQQLDYFATNIDYFKKIELEFKRMQELCYKLNTSICSHGLAPNPSGYCYDYIKTTKNNKIYIDELDKLCNLASPGYFIWEDEDHQTIEEILNRENTSYFLDETLNKPSKSI